MSIGPYPLRPGDKVAVDQGAGVYPRRLTGTVEKICPRFAVVRTPGGYRVTVHAADFGKIKLRKAGGGR